MCLYARGRLPHRLSLVHASFYGYDVRAHCTCIAGRDSSLHHFSGTGPLANSGKGTGVLGEIFRNWREALGKLARPFYLLVPGPIS